MVYAKKGMVVRLSYLFVAMVAWVLTLGGRLFVADKVILCYHGVKDSDAFRVQMRGIVNRAVAIDGKQLSKRPAVVVTFDDAFSNLIDNVIPVIQELEIPVAIYVVTGFMGEYPGWLKHSGHKDECERLMTPEQIHSLAANPLITIGSHTHTHRRLAELDGVSIEFELNQSKQILESITGNEIRSIAFPHGLFNKNVEKISRLCGFNQMLSLEEKVIPQSRIDGVLGRFSMDLDVWPIEFRLTVDGAYAWLYGFRNAIRKLRSMVG